MTFLVSFIALLIERFFDWSHLRHWQWFIHYQNYILKKIPVQPPYIRLAVVILPWIFLVLLIAWLMTSVLYGFLSLLFQLLLLIYCLGPHNIWADSFACINALTQGDARTAADKLKSSFNIESSYIQSLHKHFLNMIFIEANRRVFAVIFWYVLLGPAGAILYRLISLTASDPADPSDRLLSKASRQVELILDWLPIRLFIFFFALGGHFVQVFNRFRKSQRWDLMSSETLLADCGAAALGLEDDTEVPADCSVEKNAVSLIDRACIMLLVLIGVLYLLT